MDANTTVIDIDKGRTSGDGMEQEAINTKVEHLTTKNEDIFKKEKLPIRHSLRRKDSVSFEENLHFGKNTVLLSTTCPLPGLHTLYRRPETITRTIAPVVPRGELIEMRPRLVTPITNIPEHKKTKPPKFIPYEPYPGAVNPIIPTDKTGQSTLNIRKINKNNLDIGVLVTQMATIRTQELEDENKMNKFTDPNVEELEKLKKELEKVKEERDYFQSQFKFQTQVNTELKNLLVASVGEDLQTHVNVLTQDKLQLARRLLDTANNLTTHTEQIEFLASQCEVWRSKFLASSVMVEELARWKADLTHKNQMLNESTKRLMETTYQLRDMQLEILKNLKFIAKIRYLNLPATDVVTLSGENLNIVQQMVLHAGVGMPDANLSISSASSNRMCASETYAVQALGFISQPLMATDDAIRALFGQTHLRYNPIITAQNINSESNDN